MLKSDGWSQQQCTELVLICNCWRMYVLERQQNKTQPTCLQMAMYSAVHGFGRWSWPCWLTGLVGAVKWRGVGVHLLGTSVWQDQLCLRWRRGGLDQTSRYISDSHLAYRLKVALAKNQALRCKKTCFSLLLLCSWSRCVPEITKIRNDQSFLLTFLVTK